MSLIFLIIIQTWHIYLIGIIGFYFAIAKWQGSAQTYFIKEKVSPICPRFLSHRIENSKFFRIILFIIFRVFNRKGKGYLKLCYLAIFLIVIFSLKFQIKDWFPFNFPSLQKCLTKEFFNLETITTCHYIQHITLHKNVSLFGYY